MKEHDVTVTFRIVAEDHITESDIFDLIDEHILRMLMPSVKRDLDGKLVDDWIQIDERAQ